MTHKTLSVYDPAMCCSTGVCGPSLDQQLVRFAADIKWLGEQGVDVQRFNLAQQPGAFAKNAIVKAALEEKGEGALPLLMVDDALKTTGVYPSREELAVWVGVDATKETTELIAIGAAVTEPAPEASNCCEPAPPKAESGCGCGAPVSIDEPQKRSCC